MLDTILWLVTMMPISRISKISSITNETFLGFSWVKQVLLPGSEK